MNLEIGGGTLPTAGYTNLDYRHGNGQWRRHAETAKDGTWPAVDNSINSIRASHVMEHIAAGQDRIDVMNEAHRVLMYGGEFHIIVPLMTGSWHAIADPTHISFWVEESFYYFCDGPFRANADYGIKMWETEFWEVKNGFEGHWVGKPIK